MRALAQCYGDHAVRIVDAACSGSGRAAATRPDGVQSAVTCIYRASLSGNRELLVKVTWTSTSIALAVEDLSPAPGRGGCNCSPVFLRRKKGSKSLPVGGSVIGLEWDVSAARYEIGPEPVGGFYLSVALDAEVALVVGDSITEVVGGTAPRPKKGAEFRLVGRREQVAGNSLFRTRAAFRDGGRDHEVAIRCKHNTNEERNASELWVMVDGKKVVHVQHLRWNFRGNRTIFVDGLPVDVMWDVHDWWFGQGGGTRGSSHSCRAVFMFRTRSSLESRLWLEEDALRIRNQDRLGFYHLIHAFMIP